MRALVDSVITARKLPEATKARIVELTVSNLDLLIFNNDELEIPPYATFLHLWKAPLTHAERSAIGEFLSQVFLARGYRAKVRAFSHKEGGQTKILRTRLFVK